MEAELLDIVRRFIALVEDENNGNVLSRDMLDLAEEAREVLEEVEYE